jgi:dihydroflavonol-4-reductase
MLSTRAMAQSWTLVTGASGFLGGELVRQLVASGERVKAFVRPGANLKYLRGLPSERFELAFGDITVGHTVYRALASCDRLYHVASNYRMWAANPDDILAPAVEGTRGVLEAAKQRGLERVVVTSSVAALGAERSPTPMDETHEYNLPDAEIYVRSKYEAEQVAHEYAAEGLPVVIVNPSGVFGPGDWKPTPSGENIVRYLEHRPAFRVPTTQGGLSVADVADVARGHILAMQKGRLRERYILGGENLSYHQLIDTLCDITGLAGPGNPQSPGMVETFARLLELKSSLFGGEPMLTYRMARDYANGYVFVTSEKAERELGYSHRPARDTLTRSVMWYLANGYVAPRAARRVRLGLQHA